MTYVIVAPVGKYIDDIFVGVREFPTEKVVLISPEDTYDLALKAKESLDNFKVPVKIIRFKGHIWEGIFKEISNVKSVESSEVLVNVSTGDRNSRCAATSASFVNGLKAFAVEDNAVVMLPVLKFSYYNILGDRKMSILKVLYDKKGCCASLEALSKEVNMSLPLISYHINGTAKSDGLKEMGLVDADEIKGKIKINLSLLGKMLMKGYI